MRDDLAICDGRARPSYSCPSNTIYSAVVGETMAELVAVPAALAADQADQRYADALQIAVAACAADTAGQTCYICMDGAADEGLVRGCSCRGENGFAHVSCLARQAQVAVERRSGPSILRWYICGLCEQRHHGVVACALGWACWKTYVGRPEGDQARGMAMRVLGNGLVDAKQNADALSVEEAILSMLRRVGAPEEAILSSQGNLASIYLQVGRDEEALQIQRDVYYGYLKLKGEEHEETIRAAYNYANALLASQRYGEVKSLMRKLMPMTRRVLGESNDVTLGIRALYGLALRMDKDATLDDLREAVTTFEELEQTTRRVLGGTHPFVEDIGISLRNARAALAARETPPGSA